MAEKIKLNYGKTFLIGFGFAASMIAWIIYNAYVPLMLKENELIGSLSFSGTLIGAIMVIDNLFGVVFQPLFGNISDRTHTRFGRRTPFLLVGIPISALLFMLIPHLSNVIWAFMFCIILFNFVMSTWRSPVVALMPDLTPSEVRSEGNAVINLMGGVGTVLGTVAGTLVCLVFGIDKNDVHAVRSAVFIFGAVFMLICLFVVFFFVREPDNRLSADKSRALADDYSVKQQKKEEKEKLKNMKLTKAERKSLIFMLIALFFNSNAMDSIQTYFTTFATQELNMAESTATLFVSAFAVATVAVAIPAGKLGQKIGRKKTVIIGFISALIVFALYFIIRQNWMLYIAIICGGGIMALITINTLPLVLEIGGSEKIGTYTGYYYTATFSASVVGPVLCGSIFDLSSTYWSLFLYCPLCFLFALLAISFVKHGEVIDEKVLKEIQSEVD